MSFSWSDDNKNNEKTLSKRINNENEMDMDLLLEDEGQINNESHDSPMNELSNDKMYFKGKNL